MFIADLITLRISLSLNQNMHLLKHYSFPIDMLSAAHFGVSVHVCSLEFHKKRNFNSHHLNMLAISMSCSASILHCVVVSNKQVAFTCLTGKAEIN